MKNMFFHVICIDIKKRDVRLKFFFSLIEDIQYKVYATVKFIIYLLYINSLIICSCSSNVRSLNKGNAKACSKHHLLFWRFPLILTIGLLLNALCMCSEYDPICTSIPLALIWFITSSLFSTYTT